LDCIRDPGHLAGMVADQNRATGRPNLIDNHRYVLGGRRVHALPRLIQY
jgi:hypothetical protein